ncbi:unnamed protein product [Ceratitis capitata]|uniref:(Mediterranean fruit fly) hypothetical protein n=1 Tax=Ceratitis capitata TaxID=7213 RepID=A0A811VGC0_CERCA|nr:unnamed protein product [Ceratitis capitata]
MLEYRKRTFRTLLHALLAFLLLQALINPAYAAAKCHKCTGINCQRTTFAATEDCLDALDSCVSVFDGSTVLAQGCLGQLTSELRNKCEVSTTESADPDEIATDDGEALPTTNQQCYQCREDLCNNVSADGFECVQCDSDVDGKCASDTEGLPTEKCPIGKAVNSYCYAKLAGKHATRGCAVDLVQQKECLNSNDCVLCTPTDIAGCNREPKVAAGDGGSGGSDSGTGGDGDSNSGGSGSSDSGSGGGGGSNSGGSGGSDSGAGGGGGSNSGGNGGSDSSAGGGGSNSGGSGGSDSGAGGGGSNSGGSGGSDSGTGGAGSNTGGDNSGTDNGNGGANNDTDSGSGNDTSDSGNNNNISGAIDVST